ncbi:MAG: DUF1320 domain-containing protein [Bacteroidales bacterium]|jgi:hypothetical protein|nr:DUF1320 domain-containing protein [Bacteroidales bacterium]
MYLSIQEMKSVLYEYQMNEIVENNDDILNDAILAAISEVKSYFMASNEQVKDGRPKYDIDAIFSAEGADRNAFILRICKRVAAWNICELANPDVIYEHVKERYDSAIDTLEKIAGMGQYSNTPILITDVPTVTENPDNVQLPFRMGSRPKFHHE